MDSLTTASDYRPRVADPLLARALRTSGAVQVVGPKWCGKTTTARQVAGAVRYFQDPDQRATYASLASTTPSLLLRGEKPVLLDEWQDVPQVWDAVRFAVDQNPGAGQFILTGSTVPASTEIRHTGTGRFTNLRLRPMSLLESDESTGDVSLTGLFEAGEVAGTSFLDLEAVARALVRGGWPASVVEADAYGPDRARAYVESVIDSDISRIDQVDKNPRRVRLLMRSLARNESTEAAMTTLQSDMAVDDGKLSVNTIMQYLNALRRLFVIDDQEAWAAAVRSKVAQRTAPVRRYCDPSLPAALLALTPDKLLSDTSTFGLLFESLCVRDLKVYAAAADAGVYRYRDARGLECDAIIERADGSWGAVEIKLTADGYDEAAATLKAIQRQVRSQMAGPASFLMVITNDNYAWRDNDGIAWVPIGALAP